MLRTMPLTMDYGHAIYLSINYCRRWLRSWRPHYCSNLTNSFACCEVAESYNPSPEGWFDLFCRDKSDRIPILLESDLRIAYPLPFSRG